MATRGIGDIYAFRRLFWLLTIMVIVPTVGLSLFGFTAIRYQGAAIEAQFAKQQEDRLQEATEAVYEELEQLDHSVRLSVAPCLERSTQPCSVALAGVEAVWVWPADHTPPPELSVMGTPSEGAVTTWNERAETTVGVFRVRDTVVAWQLDMAHLQRWTADWSATVGRAAGQIALQQATESEGGLWPMRWVNNNPGERQLQGPLARHRLSVAYESGDPIQAVLSRNAWLYGISLLVLAGTIVLGTAIALTQALREFRLSQLQTDFVSTVSHELRTPLTSIRMFVDTLRSGRLEDPERVTECLELLGQETDRLSRMIERVLDWARMEAGRRTYDLEPVTARDLATEAVAAFRSQVLMDVDAEIMLDLPAEDLWLDVDRDAIVEALLNLLTNAHKYSRPPRKITLEARSRGRSVTLAISDNGLGIDTTDHKRVFEKFYQVDTRLSRSTEGSGLGLAIVRAAVHAHGGRIELVSEPGTGSKFTLWLPAT